MMKKRLFGEPIRSPRCSRVEINRLPWNEAGRARNPKRIERNKRIIDKLTEELKGMSPSWLRDPTFFGITGHGLGKLSGESDLDFDSRRYSNETVKKLTAFVREARLGRRQPRSAGTVGGKRLV